tara:strand:+ start:508 stop:783 length:276 start_codon:yes stop_codon:yes gene_type:complete
MGKLGVAPTSKVRYNSYSLLKSKELNMNFNTLNIHTSLDPEVSAHTGTISSGAVYTSIHFGGMEIAIFFNEPEAINPIIEAFEKAKALLDK